MDKALEVIWKIRRNPEIYLPERSIWYLQHFIHGYLRRLQEEGLESELSKILGSFGTWLSYYFNLLVQSQSVYHIVDSYSVGSEDAFNNFYMLFEQFSQRHETAMGKPASEREFVPLVQAGHRQNESKKDICEVLRLIRKRPELWVCYPHFSGVHAYLIGYERAGSDLGLPKEPDEKLYDDFKQWVEKVRFPEGKPRPWFKLIKVYSSSDCGSTRFSAYTAFFDLLDDFAKEIGRAGLFEVLP